MAKPFLLLLTGLVSCPALTYAQATPTPRFYVGAGALLLTQRPFLHLAGYIPLTLTGPALTAGVRVSPRVALQLSAGYAYRTFSNTLTYYEYQALTPTTDARGARDNIYSVPLLLRYSLTSPVRRLRLEALGGVSYLRIHNHFTNSSVRDGQLLYAESSNFITNNAFLNLGPSLRFAATPKLAFTAEALVNYNLTYSEDKYPYLFGNHFYSNLAAGIQYAFGS